MVEALVLTFLKRTTSVLKNILILGTPISLASTAASFARYNPRLGYWFPVLVKGLVLKG